MKKFLFFFFVAIYAFNISVEAKNHHSDSDFDESYGSESSSLKSKYYQHDIQLQLADSLGFPVPGTEFWVTLDIIKQGPKVTIHVPVINFETGPFANNPLEVQTPLLPGGYLMTASGFLPPEFRPNELLPPSTVSASNNGLSLVFSYTQPADTLPVPPTAYIVQVTNDGALQVQGAGTFANLIPPGPQILLPTQVSYISKSVKKLGSNKQISLGYTSTTQFEEPWAQDGLRDSHVNDAFDSVTAWAWVDNSNIDKTINTLNVMVAIGHTDSKGKLKVGKPVQLTDFPPGIIGWDTAVAINRTDKNNIIVSYGLINYNTNEGLLCRAVSFDGGKTWGAPYDGVTPQPFNGPLAHQPVNSYGDARGVSSDQYGNIWYSATETGHNFTYRPIFYVSTDQGVDFDLVYRAPPVPDPANQTYDFPQFCFGGGAELGNYGLWYQSSIFNTVTSDVYPTVGFIPIYQLGDFGTPSFTPLEGFINSCNQMDLTAASDGRVWFKGFADTTIFPGFTYILPTNLLFKSPGPIDQNYAGSWNTNMINSIGVLYLASGEISQPIFGYFRSPQNIIYDEARKALYAIDARQSPDYSQNMEIAFNISRDNGQTWSRPIYLNSTNFANRGFPSMALDSVTGNLVFGWYDGREDPTYQSVGYYAAILSSKVLDRVVKCIPESDPLFTIPSGAGLPDILADHIKAAHEKFKKGIAEKKGFKKHKRRHFAKA